MITASEVVMTRDMPSWKKEYLKTSNKVILGETLSPTFVGLTFQVCRNYSCHPLNITLEILRK